MITLESIKHHYNPNLSLVFAESINIKGIVKYVNVSKSYWYKGVKSGKFPKAAGKESPRKTFWDIKEVVKLLKSNPKLIKDAASNALISVRGNDYHDWFARDKEE